MLREHQPPGLLLPAWHWEVGAARWYRGGTGEESGQAVVAQLAHSDSCRSHFSFSSAARAQNITAQ